MSESGQTRLAEVDGIRGWASFVVLMFHMTWELLGLKYPSIRSAWTRPFLNGPLAVDVFFVLSGDALSWGFIARPDQGVSPLLVLKRYLRLSGPILLSCGAVYGLMKMGWVFNQAAADHLGHTEWLRPWLGFDPTVLGLLQHALSDVYDSGRGAQNYNPFLWPMGVELLGSLVVFAIGVAYSRLKAQRVFLVLLFLYLWLLGSLLALFVFGMLLGECRAAGVLKGLQQRRGNAGVTMAGLGAVVGAQGVLYALAMDRVQTQMALACVLVVLLYSSNMVGACMHWRLSQWMGRISFPLYYMHFAVLVGLTSWLVSRGWADAADWHLAALVGVSTAASLAVASAALVLERAYLKWLDRWVRDWLR
jgi:peptidoglycan/LPS O-acetylase OafA/YrhL